MLPFPADSSRMHSGFSLVELSIVLVILGLLTGGILGGQALIKAAELRAVGEEYGQWQTAVNTFRQKYFGLPGDLRNAQQFWGDGDATGETWNGDGDGEIDYGSAANQEAENLMFWQHMALAGLINGEFTGVAGAGSVEDSYIGVNVPGSKFSSAGWSIQYASVGGVYTAQWYNIEYGNFYTIGAKITGYEMSAPVMSPEDAWNIDTKFDDGQPAKGVIIARFWDDECASADDGSSATNDLEASYRLEDTGILCALGFRKAF